MYISILTLLSNVHAVQIYPPPPSPLHTEHIYPSPPHLCTYWTYLSFPSSPLYILNICILPILTSIHTEHIYPSLISVVHAVHFFSSPPFLWTYYTYLSFPYFPMYLLYIFILPLLSTLYAVHICPSLLSVVHAVHIYPSTTLNCTFCTYLYFPFIPVYSVHGCILHIV